MKFIIDKNRIFQILSKLNKLPVSSFSNITNSILIIATENKLILQYTNGNIYIKKNMPCDEGLIIEKAGSILLKIKDLFSLISKINYKKLVFETIEEKFLSICDDDHTNLIDHDELNIVDKNNFQEISFEENKDKKHVLNLTDQEIKKIIFNTKYAINQREQRIILTGLNFNLNEGKLYINGTDGIRLVSIEKDYKDKTESFSITIPFNIFNNIYSLISKNKADDIIKFEIEDNNELFINYNNFLIKTKLLNGQYPELTNIIPKEFKYRVTVNNKILLAACDKVTIYETSYEPPICSFKFEGDKVKLSSYNQEIGRSDKELPTSLFDGEKIEIKLNPKFLIDVLKKIETEEVLLKFNTPTDPIIIINNQEDNHITHLLLPLRV